MYVIGSISYSQKARKQIEGIVQVVQYRTLCYLYCSIDRRLVIFRIGQSYSSAFEATPREG